MSVRNIVKNKLHLHLYKLRKDHFLEYKMKATRLKQCKVIKCFIGNGRHRQVIIIDKRKFPIKSAHNHHNDRVLIHKETKNNFNVSRSHYPTSLMVWVRIYSFGKTPLIFLDKNTKMKVEDYQEDVWNQ